MSDSQTLLKLRNYSGAVAPSNTMVEDTSRNRGRFVPTDLTHTKLPSGLYAPTFNGLTSLIPTQNLNSVKGLPQVTLSCWFNTAVLNFVSHYLFMEPINSAILSRFAFRISATNQLILEGRSTDTDALTVWVSSVKNLTINTWYNAVSVFDSISDNHFIYLNAQPETANVAATPFSNLNPNGVPTIAAISGGGGRWSGMLAFFTLQAGAWSATKVRKVFESQRDWFRI